MQADYLLWNAICLGHTLFPKYAGQRTVQVDWNIIYTRDISLLLSHKGCRISFSLPPNVENIKDIGLFRKHSLFIRLRGSQLGNPRDVFSMLSLALLLKLEKA